MGNRFFVISFTKKLRFKLFSYVALVYFISNLYFNSIGIGVLHLFLIMTASILNIEFSDQFLLFYLTCSDVFTEKKEKTKNVPNLSVLAESSLLLLMKGWWSGGFGYGLWIGILVASGFSVVPVPSLVWKNEFELSGGSSTKVGLFKYICYFYCLMDYDLENREMCVCVCV